MPKFRCRRLERVEVYATIEADTAEDALALFDEHYPGLSSYVGNGGTNRLVGISPGDDVDYGVEPLGDDDKSEAEQLEK